jgi:RNA polymerase sigma-70 factor (ECF subfamily)
MNRPVTRPHRAEGPSAVERELVGRFVRGEREAFHLLIRPHVAALRALARRAVGDPHTADDLVQEALIRAAGGLATFRGEASLRSWLFRIVVRLAAEPGRLRRPDRAGPLEFEVPDTVGPSPEAAALGRELRDRLEEALERLPVRQRTALHLRAAEGLDYRRIAQVLDCAPGAARMLVLEARKKVAARLGSYLEP